jgi:hypothetical protein
MAVKIPTFNTNQFSFDKETKIFVAEASSLSITPENIIGGIFLKSGLTGVVAEFIYNRGTFSNDYTFLGWVYTATSKCLKRCPNLVDVEIHILND